MADVVYISPDSFKEAASPRILGGTGLELAEHQPPPPNWGDYSPVPNSVPVKQTRKICGLHRSTLILAVILIVVVIAAGVGGGVGGSLAVQNAKSNAENSLISNGTSRISTVTITSISTRTLTATGTTGTGTSTSTGSGLVVPTGLLALDCPGLDSEGDQVIAWDASSWTFTPTCGTDYVGADFGAVIVYSFHDCMQACAAHNHFSGTTQCAAVTFSANQTYQIARNFGNCWLKTGTGTQNTAAGDTFVSAVLRSSI
ncbi:hypothetical protein F4810DRAFT_696317 [Camillea tinctor]|nr:hypothetical protein F4810DRAFT_696317 [Camillea tinctor]